LWEVGFPGDDHGYSSRGIEYCDRKTENQRLQTREEEGDLLTPDPGWVNACAGRVSRGLLTTDFILIGAPKQNVKWGKLTLTATARRRRESEPGLIPLQKKIVGHRDGLREGRGMGTQEKKGARLP